MASSKGRRKGRKSSIQRIKKRRKAGWAVKDRVCGLCKKEITKDQSLNRHHICYETDTVVSLHYTCHNLVHGRCKFHNPYDKKYGKDFGPLALAFDIIRLYRPVTTEGVNYIRRRNEIR